MEASTSRLGLCKGCSQVARYTCPACAFPSCSLACSKQHKVDSNCSGIAPPVWALPLQANQLGWGPLMRDQSYISGVGRKAEEVGRQLVGDKLIPTSRRVEEGASRLDDKTDKEDKLVRDARSEGVELVLLPKGMSRRVRNGSRWDPK
ncbi:hypothetical protein BCR35DRAFT_11631 [Leucosporidium creatinivorum]|uniref:HIT-type domain-containing protein n=1 Tax=Leucosporidium creatinivorum TaxID=106004 RepID=A0A1Y2G5Z3_9BASI|nr:hypothetical protein BCR35DRAFT_11631 [Leucosporidium creatinivorum]